MYSTVDIAIECLQYVYGAFRITGAYYSANECMLQASFRLIDIAPGTECLLNTMYFSAGKMMAGKLFIRENITQ